MAIPNPKARDKSKTHIYTKMKRVLWRVRYIQCLLYRWKSISCLGISRNLLLLVFVSCMNIWLWENILKMWGKKCNLNTMVAFNNVYGKRCSLIIWYFNVLRVLDYFVIIGKDGIIKRYQSTILDNLNGPTYMKLDYISMSVKDCCSSSLEVLWTDFLLSSLHFFIWVKIHLLYSF